MSATMQVAAFVLVCLAVVPGVAAIDFDNTDRLKELIPLGCEAFDTMHTLLGEYGFRTHSLTHPVV